jgi:hypothetical protein
VLAYCTAGHTNAAAAEYFGITDRYVRKLKSRARGETEVLPIGNQTSAADVIGNLSTMVDKPDDQPHYATVTSSAVARDGQLWKCPICGEMMAPLPGTTGTEWAESGCYLHQAKAPIMLTQAEHMGGNDELQQTGPEEQDRTGEHEIPAPCLDVPARPTEQHTTLMGGTGPEEQQPVVVRERVVERVVYRIPAEPSRRGFYDRLADVQIESFMGPELGLIVAVILIAMTFWGLG